MHTVARVEAHSDYCLRHLSDPELLASTRGQVGRSNQILATLLAHLAEVEARGIHRSRACSSLYTYCIYELRMSEDAALRRAHAARILRRFPLLYEQIAAGEIHLTAVLMLGPHLTEANHVEVLARAKYRTKKEVQVLIRQLDPLPDVPACIEPLGASSPLSNPSSGKWMASLCGPVRELPPGESPKDWVEAGANDASGIEPDAKQGSGGVFHSENSSERDFADASHERIAARSDTRTAESLGSLGSQRYKVQFTASQEYVDLLEEARDLLAHAVPSRALDEVHLRALRLLVAELKKRKYALTDHPRVSAPRKDKVSNPSGRDPARVRSEAEREPAAVAVKSEAGREPATVVVKSEAGREPATVAVSARSEVEREPATVAVSARSEVEQESSDGPSELKFTTGELTLITEEAACGCDETIAACRLAEGPELADSGERAGSPRWRGRYVPAAVRRAVAERDRERCAYIDHDGRRCRETRGLEFHHLEPHACGGSPTVANLSLRCRAHNAFAAEQDFGREFMAKMKKETPHRAKAPSE